jgi:hypothetical protein
MVEVTIRPYPIDGKRYSSIILKSYFKIKVKDNKTPYEALKDTPMRKLAENAT